MESRLFPELNKLWCRELCIIDLFQITLPLSRMQFVGLEKLVEIIEKCGLEVSKPHRKGEEIKKLFEDKNYNEIEKCLRKDLEIIRIPDKQIIELMKCCFRTMQELTK